MKLLSVIIFTIVAITASAQTEIELTTNGVVLPRLTTSQKNALTPVEGQFIYHISLHRLEYYDGSRWQVVGQSSLALNFDDVSIVPGLNTINVPQITSEVLDRGAVVGYVTVSSNSFWETLPVSNNGEFVLELDRIALGAIILNSTFTQTLDFRFVIVYAN